MKAGKIPAFIILLEPSAVASPVWLRHNRSHDARSIDVSFDEDSFMEYGRIRFRSLRCLCLQRSEDDHHKKNDQQEKPYLRFQEILTHDYNDNSWVRVLKPIDRVYGYNIRISQAILTHSMHGIFLILEK